MASEETISVALDVIGEAVSIDPNDFQDHETWKFLGLGDLLQAATVSDLRDRCDIDVPDNVFQTHPTVGDFKNYLQSGASSAASNDSLQTEPSDPWEGIPRPKVPLSIILQGRLETAATVVFLFPDGSGAGTSYGTLPGMGENICLVGLNSPFLRQAQSFTCSINRMARLWEAEVRRLQPKGMPFVLGGWSAGGYYSYEVAKLLCAAGSKVARLILIDSPCRLRYEALPEAVVAELTRKGLMGASGEKKAPEWLVQHFTSTVISVDSYMPTPMPREHIPPLVNFIWVKEGLVRDVAESELDVDLDVKVTRFLLEPRGDLQSEGWEQLLPGAKYTFDYMTGNHFQITQPPHSNNLGHILRDILRK